MSKPFLILASGLLCLVSMAAQAQGEDDFNQPIKVSAGHEELDIKNNRLLLTDNVVVTQGSLVIKADRLEAERSEQGTEADTFIAIGEPATYSQKLDDGSTITAEANRITYFQTLQRLELTGNAQISQGSSRSSGEIITYDLAAQKVSASGEGSEDNRVTTIFTPRKKTNDDDKDNNGN